MKTLKLSLLSLGVSLISATTLITPVVAQTPDSEPELPSETGSADDLRVSPRGGVGFTTTGPGYEEPFFSLEGFIPLQQSPGNNLTFLEGKLLYLTDSTMGGNLVLGQRFYSSSQDQILGGYIAYDFRDTGNSFFNQIGAGFELLTNKLDFRVNGYLPIGDRRQQVAESFSNPNFEGNFLLLDRDRRFEAAVGGLDLEVGTQLARLGEGDLRGYGGVYYYNAPGGDDGFGIRGRLEARPSDNLRVGLLVQNDPLFDTRVVLSLGASFPGTRPRGAERNSTLARIGESVGRTSTITVDEQEEFETITATNPTTNEAYRFQHVNLGIGNSDGTFESPFATVQEALAIAQPNDIVYVRATIDPGIAAFRIPDNVSILSTGPAQIIDTVEAGNVQLPFSGTGLLPTITGTVALGNNTVLSGFRFLNSTGNAIEGTNVSDATIRDNVITGAAQSGISLSNVTGTTTVANNTITNSNAGISLNNNIGTVDLNIDGNSLTNNLENITVGLVDTAVGTVGVVENTVTGGGIGVGVEAGGSSLIDVNIGNNTVNNTTGTGIAVDVLGQAQVDATISENTLTNNVENITVGLVDTAQGIVEVVENTITGGAIGVGVEAGGSSLLDINIGNNTVNNTTGTGIAVEVLEQAQVDATINDNTLTNNLENITVGLVDTAQGIVEVVENTITGGAIGIGVEAGGSSLLDVNVGSNTVNNTTGTGIAVDVLEQAQVDATINDNTLTDNLENITVGLVDTAQGIVEVVENTITGGAIGVGVEAGGSSLLDINVGSNTVNNTTGTGIAVDVLGQAQVDATINDNTLTDNLENITVGLVDTAQGIVEVVENTITGGAIGVGVEAGGSSLLDINVGSNTVNNTTGTGIAVEVLEQAQVDATINDNTLTDNLENITVGLVDTAQGIVEVVENTITGGAIGIGVEAGGSSLLDVNVGSNTVNNTTGTGIAVEVLEQAQVDATINDNTLTDNLENITVGLVDTAQGIVEVVENTITGGAIGVGVEAGGSSLLDINVGSNTVEDTTGTGIAVEVLGQAQVDATINDNTLTDNLENITVGLVDTAQGIVEVVENTITGGAIGVGVEAGGSSLLDINVGSNTVEDTTGTGIAVSSADQTQVNSIISDNSLKNNVNGVNVGSTGAAQGTLTVVNNDVTNTLSGISIAVALENDSVLDIGIGGNSVDTPPGTGITIDSPPATASTLTVDQNTTVNLQPSLGGAPVIVIPNGTIPIPVPVVPSPTNPIPVPVVPSPTNPIPVPVVPSPTNPIPF